MVMERVGAIDLQSMANKKEGAQVQHRHKIQDSMQIQADESFIAEKGFDHFQNSFMFTATQSLKRKVKIINYDVELCWVYVTLLCIVLLGLIIGFILYCCYCFDEEDEKKEDEDKKMDDMEKMDMMMMDAPPAE